MANDSPLLPQRADGTFAVAAYISSVALVFAFFIQRSLADGTVGRVGEAWSIAWLTLPFMAGIPVLGVALFTAWLLPIAHQTKRRAILLGVLMGLVLPAPLFALFVLMFGIC